MAFEKRVVLNGSERSAPGEVRSLGRVADEEQIRVTVLLRGKQSAPSGGWSRGARSLSQTEMAQSFGAETSDLALIRRFAKAFNLQVVEENIAKRRVIVSGTASTVSQAFGTDLQNVIVPETGRVFRARTGALHIPTEIAPAVQAVLGLDTRPVVKPHSVKNAAASVQTFTALEVARLYNFPSNVNGAGQTIAILEFGGGFNYPDLESYFNGLGIQQPPINAISVDGGHNSPGGAADIEVMLDIQIAGTIANSANIDVYFAPNTDQGFADAILDALHNPQRKPSAISISWGGSEESWTMQALQAISSALQDAALLGTTVTAAAGDGGSTNGEGDGQLHVDFPASSPLVLACGGTSLMASGYSITSETVWSGAQGATGGGISTVYSLPNYQSAAHVPNHPMVGFAGRGVPDVAGNADPRTGYDIRLNGAKVTVGGTSAVAPLWAALIALMNQQLGRSLGYVNESLYSASTAFQDIRIGSNDDSGLGSYSAGPEWDACTGLGSPNGIALLKALQGGEPGPPPPPPPSPQPPGGTSDGSSGTTGGSIWDF